MIKSLLKTPSKEIKISLTDFMSFIEKSGIAKQTKVKQLTKRASYSPSQDFYKKIREGVIAIHKEGRPLTALEAILLELTDKKKINIFPDLIDSYINYFGKKQLTWVDPPSSFWKHKNLTIRINPELGLQFKSKKNAPLTTYFIKLHFNKTKLEKNKADLILTLMKKELKHTSSNPIEYGILDVSRKRLFLSTQVKNDYAPLLLGEADSIITIWNNL